MGSKNAVMDNGYYQLTTEQNTQVKLYRGRSNLELSRGYVSIGMLRCHDNRITIIVVMCTHVWPVFKVFLQRKISYYMQKNYSAGEGLI